MNFAIRQAGALDAQAISSLVTGLVHVFITDPASPDVQPFLGSLTPQATAARIVAPEFAYYVAERGVDLLGFAAVRGGAHLYHLFVRPEAQRHGVARAL